MNKKLIIATILLSIFVVGCVSTSKMVESQEEYCRTVFNTNIYWNTRATNLQGFECNFPTGEHIRCIISGYGMECWFVGQEMMP